MARTTKTTERAGAMKRLFVLAVAALAFAPSFADEAAAVAAGVDLDIAYCESTGEQYIDTGILGNPGLRVEADFMWLANPGNDQHVLGSFERINNDPNNPRRCYPISVSGLSTMFHYGSIMHYGVYTYNTKQRYRLVSDFGASRQSLTVDAMDGSAVSSNSFNDTYSSVATGKTLYLFALGNSTKEEGVAQMTKARVYGLKMYQNGDLVRDYHPPARTTSMAFGRM